MRLSFCFMMMMVVVVTPLWGQVVGHAQTIVGDENKFEVVFEADVVLTKTFERSMDRWTTLNNPAFELARTVRPGMGLDAHSKALLSWNPRVRLTAQIGDSLYLARPGSGLVQMIYEKRVRRSHIVPDSLFQLPFKKRRYDFENTLDILPKRLERYVKYSSRVVGVYHLSVNERSVLAVVLSHDHLLEERSRSTVTVALYTPGLFFLDLIRIPDAPWMAIGTEPVGSYKDVIYWRTSERSLKEMVIRSTRAGPEENALE